MSRVPLPVRPTARPTVEALEDRRVLSTTQFVLNLYADLLDRIPSPNEAAYWVNVVNVSRVPPAQVALGFLNSDEFLIKEVVADYQSLLGRTPGVGEIGFWVGARRRGLTPRQEAAAFMASPEYYARQGAAPGVWAIGVFRDVLGRLPDGNTVSFLSSLGLNDYFIRFNVARAIIASTEANARTVDAAYVRLFERNVDNSGSQFYTNQLTLGLGPTDLQSQIAGSFEYVVVKSGGLDVAPQVLTPSPARPGTTGFVISTPLAFVPIPLLTYSTQFTPGFGFFAAIPFLVNPYRGSLLG